MLVVEEDVRNLAARLQEVNQGWDNREVGLSVTDAALVKETETAEGIWIAFEQIVPPADLTRSDVHDAIRSQLDRIRIHTGGILAGLRSADTGEARTEALAVVLATVGTLEAEINRAATSFGYQNPERNVPRPRVTTSTTTTTTTRPKPTTTTAPISDAQAEAMCRADLDCILAAFAVTIAEQTAILGATLDQAVQLATGACDLLDAGIPWTLVLADIVIDPVLTEEELMADAGIMGPGVNAFCPEHWWQVEEFNH
ncbi:MAG: hypothetical protein KTV45_14635 [Acidimicrobiia bacterium]|nr:hypothetical protein [Acidimicrobiia bacterium]